MKTMISILMISLLTIPVLGAMDNPPRRIALEEEAYVDDIPFDTRSVVMSLAAELPEEEYVDDIPFNTLDVLLLSGITLEGEENIEDSAYPTGRVFAMNGFYLEEEAPADDIPFNTLDVITLGKVELPEEEYVNDIPFDTGCIVKSLHKDQSTWARCMLPLNGHTAEHSADPYLGFAMLLMSF